MNQSKSIHYVDLTIWGSKLTEMNERIQSDFHEYFLHGGWYYFGRINATDICIVTLRVRLQTHSVAYLPKHTRDK